MNRVFLFLLVALLSAAAFGCKGPVGYKSLRAVATGVDAALEVYGEAYRAGKINQAQRDEIAAAHVKYQAAMRTAIAAARMDLSKPAPSDLVSLASSLIATVSTFTGKAIQ